MFGNILKDACQFTAVHGARWEGAPSAANAAVADALRLLMIKLLYTLLGAQAHLLPET